MNRSCCAWVAQAATPTIRMAISFVDAKACKKINRSHAHDSRIHDSRTHYSHEHRATAQRRFIV